MEEIMDNNKRNIHNSGPLGMLIKKGQVKKIDDSNMSQLDTKVITRSRPNKMSHYFKTQSGIEFTEHELIYVDPNECKPWKYANRQEDELGDMNELIESIRINKQLQPALIRLHPEPHDGVIYEIIFGRRRHAACLKLGIPFLVILKNISNIQEAIMFQDAENKFRKNVSHYSNAMLYKRLLDDCVFKTEKALADKLRISTSSLSDLMSFTKIPQDIVVAIPDIHSLSKSFALKIISLLNKSKNYHMKLLDLAPKIGTGITSPARLGKIIENHMANEKLINKQALKSKQYKSRQGEKLFTFKYDQRGTPSIAFNKEFAKGKDFNQLCNRIQMILEEQFV